MPDIPWRVVFPRSVAVLCLVALGVQALLLVVLATTDRDGGPHDAPVAVVAPPVVAEALADQANGLEGDPFEAYATDSTEDALASLRTGDVVAVLQVDLRGTRDVLVLNEANGDRLSDAVRDRVAVIEESYDRRLSVQTIDTSSGSPSLARALGLVSNVVGFLFVVVVSLWRGPVARTLGRALMRHVALGATAVVASACLVWAPFLGPGDPSVSTWALLALAVLVAGSVTLALEALADLAGLALAVTLFLLQAAPLLLRTDVKLLPQPLPTVLPFTPLGAMDEALVRVVSFDDPGGPGRAVFVLTGWLVVAWLTALVARRMRSHDPSRAPRGTPSLWRLRVGAVVVPAAALMLAVAAVLPHDAVAGPEELPSRASETECVPIGKVRGIADLNRITRRLRGGDEFQGGDVGASVTLQDGRMLFVFGDTLRSADYEGQRFVRNSMLVIEDGCLQMVAPADHGAIIPDRTGKRSGADAGVPVGYWPMSIGRQQRPGYDLVAISAQRVRATGRGEFDFENLGTAIAVFVVPRGGTPQLVDVRDIGPDDADPSRPTWGAASAISDGWAYLYGTSSPGQDLVFGYALSVARVRPDEILDRSKWRFWDGSDWVQDADRAAELIPAEGGTSQTLSVFEQDGTWFALSKRDEFLGTDLTVWTAPTPHGPFTAHEPLAKLPSDTVRGELRYMPLAHPGMLPRPGTMVVSYSRNRTDVDEVIKNPLAYRPRFLRVKLPR